MGEEKKLEKGKRFCPYCDEEIAEVSFPYCDTCAVTVFYCPRCRKPLSRENRVCPYCGAEVKGEV